MSSGIEKITDKITQQAQQNADEMLQAAKEEAVAIVQKTKEQVAYKSEKALLIAQENAKELFKRKVSVAELESRKMRLAAKQEMIEKTFSAAMELLCSMPQERYVEFLSTLISQSAKGGEQVILNKKDKEEIGAKLMVHIGLQNLKALKLNMVTLSPQTADIPGGFILKDKDVEYNNSFTALINSCREELIPEVVNALFQ